MADIIQGDDLLDTHLWFPTHLVICTFPFCLHPWLHVDRTLDVRLWYIQLSYFNTVLQMDRLVLQSSINDLVFTGQEDKRRWFWIEDAFHRVVLKGFYLLYTLCVFYLLIKNRENVSKTLKLIKLNNWVFNINVVNFFHFVALSFLHFFFSLLCFRLLLFQII